MRAAESIPLRDPCEMSMRKFLGPTCMLFITLSTLWSACAFSEIPAARQRELVSLLNQDCGSCHGLTRQGGLGPPLTKQALMGKSETMLREVILNGRPGTPMAPWKLFLNPQEADWLTQVLLEGKTFAR